MVEALKIKKITTDYCKSGAIRINQAALKFDIHMIKLPSTNNEIAVSPLIKRRSKSKSEITSPSTIDAFSLAIKQTHSLSENDSILNN